MKKIILFLLFVGFLPQIIHAQKTAKAIWCKGNTTLYFTYDTNTYAAGGTYDGQTITNVYPVPVGGFSGGSGVNSLPMYSIRESVTKVVIETNYSNFKPTGLNYYFYGFKNLTTITGLGNIDTGSVTTMEFTFYGCSGITSLDGLSNWDTGSVTTMYSTFSDCSGITSLDPLSNWDTSSLTYLWGTFSGCSGITSLDPLSNWDTSSLTDLWAAFSGCRGITSLEPLRGWDTSNVTDMSEMFDYCTGITSLEPLRGWDTGSVTTMEYTFYGCSGITSLEPLRGWDTSNVTGMRFMFCDCSGITSLEPLRGWDTSKVTRMNSMFRSCSGITSLDLSSWDTSKVEDMRSMFVLCHSLTSITFGQKFSLESISELCGDNYFVDDTAPFAGCPKLRYIDFYDSDMTNMPSVKRSDSNNMFFGVPRTTVIYRPHDAYQKEITGYTTGTRPRPILEDDGETENVVYMQSTKPMPPASYAHSSTPTIFCDAYYSVDKVDIELPRAFRAASAEYSRDMTDKTYGSVILPYDFTSNADIQAYALTSQNDAQTKLTFTDVETVPAHTPFAFKKLGNAEFIRTNIDYDIIVNATHSTSVAEGGEPYEGTTGLSNWKTKGYYISETIASPDYEGMYFIQGDKFKRATGNLNMFDHRVLFYPTDAATSAKPFFKMAFSDDEIVNAIEAAETEKTVREAEAIYDIQGRKVNANANGNAKNSQLRKGINIVRMSDGTTKKVVIR